MSLTRSLDVARSHLSSTAEYMQQVSRNVARANEPFATRKISQYVTSGSGSVYLAVASRSEDKMLFAKALSSISAAARDKEVMSSLDQMNDAVGNPDDQSSPAALIQKLENALQSYTAGSHNVSRQAEALTAARDLATRLNVATTGTQSARTQADKDMSNAIGKVNDLLSQFKTLNDDITRGTITGRDVTDQADSRDRIVNELAEQFGLRAETRENSDMVLILENGVVLFDKTARSVSFTPTGAFDASVTGNAVFVDGVPVTGPNAVVPLATGRIAGLTKVRDVTAVQYQKQLDEIARGLIQTFSETGPTGLSPQLAGLFTNGALNTVPAIGAASVGVAGRITVNALVDPNKGGVADRLRDGIAYTYNPGTGAGYTDRLNTLISEMSATRAFDPTAGVDASASILQFSSSSDGWLSAERQRTGASYEYTSVMYERASDALVKATGVNVEEEYLVMLELERSYQASSKLIATVDKMFEALLAAAR